MPMKCQWAYWSFREAQLLFSFSFTVHILSSKFVPLLIVLITLIHVAENSCRTLYSRNPRDRGGRGAEDECCCGCLFVSHIELVLLRPLLPQILLVYWLSLLLPHSVLIIASTLPFFERNDDFMSFASSGRLD